MSKTPPPIRKGAPPKPGVTQATHQFLKREPGPNRPEPKPGFHPKGGANASTVQSDSGASYTSQQAQQLQDKGGS